MKLIYNFELNVIEQTNVQYDMIISIFQFIYKNYAQVVGILY